MEGRIDFTSGHSYEDILIQLLHSFRDLITFPDSIRTLPDTSLLFSKDLLNEALSICGAKLLSTGSRAEGLLTISREPVAGFQTQPLFTPEVDFMTVVSVNQLFSNWNDLKIEKLASDSCFVRLSLPGSRTAYPESFNAGGGESEYLSPNKFKSFILRQFEQTLATEKWSTMISDWVWDKTVYAKSASEKQPTTLALKEHGPAIQFTVVKRQDQKDAPNPYSECEDRYLDSADIDLVPSLHLSGWPDHANEWVSRQRRWPSQSTIDQIASAGVMVVCKSPKNGNLETDWRLSFSNAEVTLFTMNELPCRNFAHRIFKYTVKHLVLKPKVINSYHCKSITLWACERVPPTYWSWDNLAMCVLGLFDDLIGCIAARSCPHYFIRSCNLFKDIPHDFLDTVGKKLVEIRKNPLLKRPCIGQAEEKELVKHMQAKSLRYPEIRKVAELLLRLQFNNVV